MKGRDRMEPTTTMTMAEYFNILFIEFNTFSVTVRVLLSALMGGLIGNERGRTGRPAGLRTHILVCTGATLTTLMGVYTAEVLGYPNDPLRVGAQVISGIGFLGAGTILMRGKMHVLGLTTAAGLWTTATLGLCLGIGFYWGAILGFLVILFAMLYLTRAEVFDQKRNQLRTPQSFYLEIADIDRVNDLHDMMSGEYVHLHIVTAKSGMAQHIGIELTTTSRTKASDILMYELRDLDYITFVVPVII